MKKYKITVNGQQYDVSVEELGASSAAQVATPVQAAPTAPTPQPVMAAPATTVAPAPAGSAGAGSIRAPMPGTVTGIKVSVGQAVKRGDVVLLLEAMKMENEICAQSDGVVSAIRVQTGASVNTGDPMVDVA